MLLARLEALPDLRRPRAALALLATALLSLPASSKIVRELFADSGWEADYGAFGKAVPPARKSPRTGDRRRCTASGHPRGRYLNVLDPIFANAYDAQRRVFESREPDVPRVVRTTLDSDYIAFPSTSPYSNASSTTRASLEVSYVPALICHQFSRGSPAELYASLSYSSTRVSCLAPASLTRGTTDQRCTKLIVRSSGSHTGSATCVISPKTTLESISLVSAQRT
ncbi:MAG TPA: hypothetical protein VGD79_06655 [Thermoanaerobaculia bacterium]